MTLSHYLLVSGVLFCTGLLGVLVRRNLLVVFMCLEMMLAAASLSLVAFARFRTVDGLPAIDATTLVFFVITVAAAEVAVGLAIIISLFRTKQTVDLKGLDSLHG
jgi:NADH-quinone oxidoreductase subunit K